MNKNSQEFIRLLTQAQSSLYAYILSLVLDHAQAEDLLQETNVTLWQELVPSVVGG
jgi:RNA polymerase sigma-70 factor (ECF subfamily)